MASTYTTSLKIQEIGNGEQSGSWGSTTNTNWTLIEQAVAGVQTITISNSNYTLTNLNGVLDEARNMVLVVTGTNSSIYQIVAPLNQPKLYVVSNQTTGGYAITIGASSGSIVTIPNGVTAQVYTDGTNFYSAQTGSAGNFNVNGTLTASGITDTGALSASSLSVTGTSTFTGIPSGPTATVGTNTTQLATTAFVTTATNSINSVTTGTIQMWPTVSAPSGYLLCDGSAVSRTTYATLFSVINTTFGSGDGSTTFNLPNYLGRSPLGVSGSYALASTGGSADAVVVSHTHSVTDPGHTHATNPATAYIGTSPQNAPGGAVANPGTPTTLSLNTATTGITINSTGVSGTGANLVPYLAINFIIKT
jgi:microcystin-dependent protein